jgi:hypothetical protein
MKIITVQQKDCAATQISPRELDSSAFSPNVKTERTIFFANFARRRNQQRFRRR